MSSKELILNLKVWRQKDAADSGRFAEYTLEKISPDMSFLEMLDQLNEGLIKKGDDPVSFDSDCREGICGMCSCVINGTPHGPEQGSTACQLHMRKFQNGETVIVEPWRAKAFPVAKDLAVDRSAFDRIQQAGGYISVKTGQAQDANCIPVAKSKADTAFDAAACIGCGACVAACKNASAMLFVAAKVSHFALLPQGQVEAKERALRMVAAMDKEGFGNCTNEAECQAVCPKSVSIEHIARLNREYLKASLF